MIFQKRGGGGQQPFGTFPKIHPFWWGQASLIGAHQNLNSKYQKLNGTHQKLIGTHQKLIGTKPNAYWHTPEIPRPCLYA